MTQQVVIDEIRALRDELKATQAERDSLREALAVYADHRHWGITRDEFRHPSAVWIGPGAVTTAVAAVPDAPMTARQALEVTR